MIELETLRGKMLEINDVASLLGIKPDSVRRRIRIGALPARENAGTHKRLILGDDLIAYLKGEILPSPATRKPASERAGIAQPVNSSLFESEPVAMEASERYALKDVARIIGLTFSTVVYHVKKGTLKAETEKHGKRSQSFVTHESLRAFVKNYNPKLLDRLGKISGK
jgi:hypothetical protein